VIKYLSRFNFFIIRYQVPVFSLTLRGIVIAYLFGMLLATSANIRAQCSEGEWDLFGPTSMPDAGPGVSLLESSLGIGRVIAIAEDPSNGSIMYLGSESGGLWKHNTTTQQSVLVSSNFDGKGVSNIAIDPINSDVIYVTTGQGEGFFGSAINFRMSGSGVYKSTDGGTNWTSVLAYNSPLLNYGAAPTPGPFNNQIQFARILIHPTNPNILLVAVRTLEDTNDPARMGVMLRSVDGGIVWTKILSPVLESDNYFWDLEQHPFKPSVVYASSRRLYRSNDFGITWTDKTPSPVNFAINGVDENSMIQLAVSPEKNVVSGALNDWILIGVNSGVGTLSLNKLYLSKNELDDVQELLPTTSETVVGYSSSRKHSLTVNSDFTFALLGGVPLGRFSISGSTLEYTFLGSVSSVHDDIKTLYTPIYNGTNGSVVYAGTDGGFYTSLNGGVNFTESNDGLSISQFYSIDVSEQGKRVLGGTQDNATLVYDGTRWFQTLRGDGDDVSHSRDLDVLYQNTVYHGDYFNPKFIASLDGGLSTGSPNGATIALSKKGFYPIESSPLNALDIFVGASTVSATTGQLTKYNHSINPIVLTDFGPPIPSCNTTHYNPIRAIGLSYSDANRVYVATDGYWLGDNGHNEVADCPGEDAPTWNDNGYRILTLFRYNGSSWVDVSPQTPGIAAKISSISVDPDNHDRLWITYYSPFKFSDKNSGHPTVWKSENGGNTWTSDATGLPYAFTSKIIIDESAVNRQFVATDKGVYWRENTTVWTCFAEGLPSTLLMDLDIGYCQGKLALATFGRGIWTASLPPPQSPKVLSISGNEIWSDSRTVYTDIHIIAGGKLTIQPGVTINMAEGKGVVINQGGRLDAIGANITNLCGKAWAGIQVKGHKDTPHPGSLVGILSGIYPSHSTDHGVLYLEDAIIEHATSGIAAAFGSDAASNGGIIYAKNTTFRENGTSVLYKPYGFENLGTFVGCTFITKGSGIPTILPAIDLNEIVGVSFIGCQFQSGSFVLQSVPSDVGIRSFDASYVVSGGSISSSFENLIYGIRATGSGKYLADPLKINNITFTNNLRGVLISGLGNVKVEENTFKIPDFVGITPSYGLYLESSFDYEVEQNSFLLEGIATFSLPWMAGIYVDNNADASTLLNLNQFNFLEAGIRCQGDNSQLQIRCNDYTNIYRFNIAVTGSGTGGLPDQGNCLPFGTSGAITAPAGNSFSHDCLVDKGDIFVQNGMPGFVYSHHSDLKPECVSNSVFLEDCNIASTGGNPCPIPIPGSERRASGFTVLEQLEQQLDSLIALPDGGDQDGLLAVIADPTYDRAGLFTRLMAVSPYCSDAALLSLLEHKEQLSTAQLVDVLTANSPLSTAVLAAAGSTTGLTAASLSGLGWASDSERSAMQALTARMERLNWERDVLLQQISKDLMEQEQMDSALWLLAGETRTGLVKYRAHLLAASGQADSALSQLQKGLNPANPLDKAYLDYIAFRLDTLATSADSLAPASITFLRTLGSKEHRAGVWALNLPDRKFAFLGSISIAKGLNATEY